MTVFAFCSEKNVYKLFQFQLDTIENIGWFVVLVVVLLLVLCGVVQIELFSDFGSFKSCICCAFAVDVLCSVFCLALCVLAAALMGFAFILLRLRFHVIAA